MSVGRSADKPGGDAIGILAIDSAPPAEALAEITAMEDVSQAWIVKLPPAGGACPPGWVGSIAGSSRRRTGWGGSCTAHARFAAFFGGGTTTATPTLDSFNGRLRAAGKGTLAEKRPAIAAHQRRRIEMRRADQPKGSIPEAVAPHHRILQPAGKIFAVFFRKCSLNTKRELAFQQRASSGQVTNLTAPPPSASSRFSAQPAVRIRRSAPLTA